MTEDELALIQSMNRLLYKSVTKFNSAVKKHIDTLLHIDPAINTDVATLIVLNYCSRAWGDVGFLPVIDLFNHSEKLGNTKEVIDQKTYSWQKLTTRLAIKFGFHTRSKIYITTASFLIILTPTILIIFILGTGLRKLQPATLKGKSPIIA